ncbi:hypothetical protein OSTOST_16540 [Ostertagia ostertagi]
MLKENWVLFQEGLGRCTTTKVSLKFKQGMEKPKFCWVRPVPIALRPQAEAKLKDLVENGTLTRVEHAEWATPLVIVAKPDGKTSLCGNYKDEYCTDIHSTFIHHNSITTLMEAERFVQTLKSGCEKRRKVDKAVKS